MTRKGWGNSVKNNYSWENKMVKKKVLITGAAGFLGKRLAKRLNNEDYHPCLTSLESNKDLSIEKLNLLNYSDIEKVIKKTKPAIVYHLGALVNLSRDYEVAQQCIGVNIKGTLNLLESLRIFPPKKFIFTSTEEIYGDNPLPFKENQLPQPPSTYSISKIAAENLCKMYAQALGFSLVIFRIGTIYGSEQPLSRFIAQIIVKALENEDILINSGEKKRDYVYIENVVDALILSQKIKLEHQIETINLGGQRSYQLKRLVEMIIKLTKSKSRVTIGAFPDRVSEADEWLMDITKAKKLLNWKPTTSLESGLKQTINYFKENINKI